MTFIKGSALFASGEACLRRFCHIGDLTLDLFHHDGRVEDSWLALQPHEFELLWKLAKAPRHCLPTIALIEWTRNQVDAELATDQLVAKLSAVGLADLLTRHPEGYYCLKAPPAPSALA